MKSHTTACFRKLFIALPESVREQARQAYRFFQENPNHPSLQFKRIHTAQPIYSATLRKSVATLWGFLGKPQKTAPFIELCEDPPTWFR